MTDCLWGDPGVKGWDFICRSDAAFNLAVGAVSSGKTINEILRWIDYIGHAPPGPLAMVGKTERTLKNNILDPMEEALGSDKMRISIGMGSGVILGRKILIFGANDERAEAKIRGGTFAGMLGDEITLWPESFFQMALSRLRVKGAKGFGTTNTDGPNHWLKQYIDRPELIKAGDLKVWNFKIEDNEHLDPKYVARLKRQYVGLWKKRFIDGLWCLAEGAIFDMFDDAKHIYHDGPGFNIKKRHISIDYGTANPTTFGLYGVNELNPLAPKVALESSYYYDSKKHAGKQKTDGEYCDDLEAFIGATEIEYIIVDPSAASFIAEIEKRIEKGTIKAMVMLAKNDVLNGIRTVSEFLANVWFVIHAACTEDVAEMNGYVWDAKASAKGEDKPIKMFDHCCDRSRYLIYTLFGKPLNEKVAAVYDV